MQKPIMKNSCGKTTVIKNHDKFQRLNQKNYVLLIITFLQIHLALTFSICFNIWRWLYSCYTLFVCEDLCFSRKSLSCMPLECDLIITGFVWVTAFPLTINSVLVPISCASSLNLLRCLLLMCPGFLRKIVPPTTNKSYN